MTPAQSDYEHLLELRTGLRRFLRWNEDQAKAHSAVGLVDRAACDGLVKRTPDPNNRSVVRVTLTAAGAAKLDLLAEAHMEEITHLAPTMRTLWRVLQRVDGDREHPRPGGAQPGKDELASRLRRQPARPPRPPPSGSGDSAAARCCGSVSDR